jgi:ADP-dependent NAD(P)H-hydrate dehydratase / NAD(P)H-hydrate epimerase
MIAGLLARGLAPLEARRRRLAPCRGGRRFGPGLIAEDLPEALPAVLRDLGV